MFRMHKIKYNFKSDEKIEEQIKVPKNISNDSFDVESLYTTVRFILKRSIRNFQEATPQVEEEEPKPKGSLRLPICYLKKIISSELLSCKDQLESAEIAHETAVSILKKLEDCTWMAKAVLTLAVFAKEYGDFIEYHRNKYNINNDLATSDQLTDSLAFLKGWKIELLDKQKTEIRELNVLIEKTLELMNAMNELEKFSKNRKVSMDGVKADLILPEEVDYYWVIMAVIACVNKFTTILTSSYQQL
ncbi:uncharacterized protein LOC133031149 [Cannabis sativa]|uniref:uncharacterized protein LOC133031149 n=1 Tax=Cannabis sativa TaxID=3483 RepID=UPI0029C9DB67|nr:uncharacterized protein LOC133031149 [Cannabis sativa]